MDFLIDSLFTGLVVSAVFFVLGLLAAVSGSIMQSNTRLPVAVAWFLVYFGLAWVTICGGIGTVLRIWTS